MGVFGRTTLKLKASVRLKSTSRSSSFEYCVDLVRKYDYENYLSTLLLSKEHAKTAFAIRAFNIEVANVQQHAKEEGLIQMRLKFWEDTVGKIFSNNPPNHPVAIEVHKVLKKNALNKKYLTILVESRYKKLSFPTLNDMEDYAENTASPILYLQLSSSGIKNLTADHACSHLGKGQGLTNLLRSVPYYAMRQVVVLPQDSLLHHRVPQEAIIRGKVDESLRTVVYDVASRAHQHFEKAQSMLIKLHPSLHKHFLPIVPSKGYLERLQKIDFDVFHPSLQSRDHMLPLRLLWKSWLGFTSL